MSTEQDHRASVLACFNDGNASVGVVGLGYVGLPLALRCVEAGLRVVGFDTDKDKITKLEQGNSYLRHIDDARVRDSVAQGFRVSDDFATVAQLDAVLICVPTPLTRAREPDLSFVRATMDQIAPHLRVGQLLSLESTTYPGTTEEELRPRLEAVGLEPGHDIFLVYSPEREDPGNARFTTRTIPKLVGGSTQACLEVGVALYQRIVDQVVPMSSTRAAEMTKLMENIHRAVNIGLVNEMKVAADSMGLDIHEIINAAATKPFGFTPYRPGPGIGGHCIPIDPFYLTWKAREFGVHTRFIELAGEINSAMPGWVMQKIVHALNGHSKSVRGSRVLVLGVAYKKNLDDLRQSPALDLLEMLRDQGADFAYSDPHVPRFPRLRDHSFELNSTALTAETLAAADCVVLVTDHDAFDYALIERHACLIVDTRGRFSNSASKVISA